MKQYVFVVKVRTESGDEYIRTFHKKPNVKKLSNVLFKWLGYETAKELETHFLNKTHFYEIEKFELL